LAGQDCASETLVQIETMNETRRRAITTIL
jgi:hypothetical protein